VHDRSVSRARQRFRGGCALTPIGCAPSLDHRASRHDVTGSAESFSVSAYGSNSWHTACRRAGMNVRRHVRWE
jgi:hypothetical protein